MKIATLYLAFLFLRPAVLRPALWLRYKAFKADASPVQQSPAIFSHTRGLTTVGFAFRKCWMYLDVVYWCSLIVVACNWSTLKATIRGFLFWKFVCIHQFVVLFAFAFATHAHSEDVIPFLGLKTHQRTTHSNTSHKTSQSSCIFLQSFDMFEVWTAVCTAWSTFFLAEGIFSRTLCDSHLLVESEIGYKTIQNSLWILQNYKYTKLYWPAIGHSEECVQQASTSWSQLQLVGAPLMELEPCSLSTGFPFFCLESL